MREFVLSAGWQLKLRSEQATLQDDLQRDADWLPAKVPGSAHEALWAAGRIGDPYTVDEQTRTAWLAERDFLYRCRFDLPSDLRTASNDEVVQLCCDGLDTIATVYLNGHKLLHSDNMFLPATAVVTSLLRPRDNELCILFESALRIGRARQQEYGPRPVWNGDASRVYVRKAQYQYGWDFGPTLLGAGPWRNVRLIAYTARLVDVRADFEVTPTLDAARLSIAVELEDTSAQAQTRQLEIRVHSPDGAVLHHSRKVIEKSHITEDLHIANPVLWWPRGHGLQPRYRLEVQLFSSDGHVLDEKALTLGARRLRLVQNALPDGRSFYFEINNQPIFCGGANWIPADLLPTRVSAQRYRALLETAAAANMNMLRVWGGGIYEEDIFYDLCDELGILVWQDFLFACGLYPAHFAMADSVAAEATAAIRRLRHHPSIVIWAGNNEDYSIAASVRAYHGPDSRPAPPGPSSLKEPIFDGRRLYEDVLARVCQQHDSTRPYWPGSPYSSKEVDPNSPVEGDRHIWEIWHFPMLDYQNYGLVQGRFGSEFGMQAAPDLPTLERALGTREFAEDKLSVLNKGQDGPGRIRHYIERNLRPPTSLDEYLYATQLVQAEALVHAVRSFRRKFDANRRSGGALVWQLNDCWPGISWSMLAFCEEGQAVQPKPSLYAVARELAPFAIGLESTADGGVAAWVLTPPTSAGDYTLRLRLRAFTLNGTLLGEAEQALHVPANQATELGELTILRAQEAVVYGAQLYADAQQVARAVLWPQPLRTLSLQDPDLQIRVQSDKLHLSVRRPAKGVLLRATGPVRFGDNLLDLLPDEPISVPATGLLPSGPGLQVRSLYGKHV